MELRAKIALGVSALVVGGLAAAALPTVMVIADAAHTTAQGIGELTKTSTASPTPTPTREETSSDEQSLADLGYVPLGDGTWIPAGGPGECTTTAMLGVKDGVLQMLGGAVMDMGVQDGARGEVVSDAAGIRAYIVAPNDNLIAIGERLCVSYPGLVPFNHVLGVAIQPGQELILRPDPDIPWIDPYSPYGAIPNETNTVAYNTAIYEMGTFVRNRDLTAARALWTQLAPDINPAIVPFVAAAFDSGDWYVLGHLFP